MRVLVVEDHASLAREVAVRLRREGMAVDIASDGGEALVKCDATEYDVVLLDRDLPVFHGDDVCRALVARGNPPRILMLTAARGTDAIVEGLSLGADDYLPKPFEMVELVARVRSLARRPTSASAPVIEIGDLVIDGAARSVTRSGRSIGLTPKEFGVLQVLATSPGAVVSSETLLEKVWDEFADPFTNAVRVTMATLRRKLGTPETIVTVKKAGYRLVVKEEP